MTVNMQLNLYIKHTINYRGGFMTNKTEKIIDLMRNKTKKTSIMINEELWDLFKQACAKNSTTPTLRIEKYMINYVDENNLL